MKKKALAEGEVTGHAHVVTDKMAEVFGDGERRELHAPNGTAVVHEEHGEIKLPAGDYDISQQREIDPDTDEARAVRD